MTTQQVYSIPELQANVETNTRYLRAACAGLGRATDPADVKLQAIFAKSAAHQVDYWTARLEEAKNG
jgi:hypothetical protein